MGSPVTVPIGSAPPPVSRTAVPGAQNEQMAGERPFAPGEAPDVAGDFGVSEDDKNKLISILSTLRSGWMQDRMERIRLWMLSVTMEKGIQWVGWDQTSNTWFDALAEVRNNGLIEDGESVELERWMNNITLMFKQIFVGNLTQAIPHSIVRPQNADKPNDVQTAKAAGDVVEILDRKNHIRRLMRSMYETLFTFGCYFRYTRPVLDGVDNGYDEEAIFEDLEVQMPARMKCLHCGKETPLDQLPPQISPGMLTPCPACGTPLGGESYYASGEGNRLSLRSVGARRIPRASVKQSIHTPLEIDVSPSVKEWWQSPTLSFDQEINYGEALMMFPKYRDKIEAGAAVDTTPNADWERLMRIQERSVTSGYAADLNQARPTYSQNWFNPEAFYTLQDYEFGDRMKATFPEGLKMTTLGGAVVDIRPAAMRREWSSCRLYEGYGPYCPSIAERVVPFNQRFNAAMQMLDDWMQRASTGLNVADASRLDTQKTNKLPLTPAHILAIPMRINGEVRPLAEVFQHYDLPMNPAAWNYPNLLLNFCQLIAGLPPQMGGQGTEPGVETLGGQRLLFGQATSAMRPYWENVKDECAEATYNEIYAVKRLMSAGALDKLWRVEETRGAGFRNQQVDWSRLQGEIEVFSDEDQGLPTSPDELRQAYQLMFEQLTSGNPAAQAWFNVPSNAEQVLNTMLPGSSSPVAPQITKTQMDIKILLTQPSFAIQNPDGSMTTKLPVEPDKNFEDYTVAKACLRDFAMQNNDLRFSNPEAWERLNAYAEMLEDLDAQIAAERAQRQMKVNQAGLPPKPGPDPGTQALLAEVQQLGTQMMARLGQLATIDPAVTKGTISGQVSAANDVGSQALKLAKLVTGS